MVCGFCDNEMKAASTVSCVLQPVVFCDGKKLPTVRYDDDDRRCPDCNIASGGYHHPGCDMERCPRCGEQLISCDCELM